MRTIDRADTKPQTLPQISLEPLAPDTLEEAAAFIRNGEHLCVSLSSRLAQNGKPVMPPGGTCWLLKNAAAIIGICAVSPSGLMQHYFPFALQHPDGTDAAGVYASVQKCIAKLLSDKDLYCLMGEKAGNTCIKTICWQKPATTISYELMIRQPSRSAPEFPHVPLPAGCSVVQCKPSDADALFTLQKGYDIEEVIPKGSLFHASICVSNLKKQLETQLVFGVKHRGIFIAKAGTNARGFNFDQIGGVYTLPAWRNKGIAGFLVNHVAGSIESQRKQAVLFVKTTNKPAKAAYTRIGFQKTGNYEIVYY